MLMFILTVAWGVVSLNGRSYYAKYLHILLHLAGHSATISAYESPRPASEPSSMTTMATIKDSGIIRPTQRIHKADSTLGLQVGIMAPRRTEQKVQENCFLYVPQLLGMAL